MLERGAMLELEDPSTCVDSMCDGALLSPVAESCGDELGRYSAEGKISPTERLDIMGRVGLVA